MNFERFGQRGIVSSLIALVLAISGCSEPAVPAKEPAKDAAKNNAGDPTLVESIPVKGFDPDGEPVIKKWSDGTLQIHFEAMPPFFAEDQGTERQFDNFEGK